MLTSGDLVKLNTNGYSDLDGIVGIVLSIDTPWYASSLKDYLCKIFFPNDSEVRYYSVGNLEKLT